MSGRDAGLLAACFPELAAVARALNVQHVYEPTVGDVRFVELFL